MSHGHDGPELLVMLGGQHAHQKSLAAARRSVKHLPFVITPLTVLS